MVSESELYRLYSLLQRLHQVRWASVLSEMTHLEYMTLSAIANSHTLHPERPGIYVTELSRELCISVSMVSKLLGALEKKGWILRTPDPQSRRNTFVSMTSGGSEVFALETARVVAATERVFEKMGPEALDRFLTAAEQLADCYGAVLGTE